MLKDGTVIDMEGPGQIERSEDGRFFTVKHKHGSVTVSHEQFAGFRVYEGIEPAMARADKGGW